MDKAFRGTMTAATLDSGVRSEFKGPKSQQSPRRPTDVWDNLDLELPLESTMDLLDSLLMSWVNSQYG